MDRKIGRFIELSHQIKDNQMIYFLIRGGLMGGMLIAIFLHLLNTELTSAPEFIYNQF